MCQLLIFFSQWIIKLLFLLDLTYFIHVKRYQGMDGAMVGLGGAMAPPNFFFLNIIKYMGTNFSNFVLENYTFVPLKISLILLRALL